MTTPDPEDLETLDLTPKPTDETVSLGGARSETVGDGVREAVEAKAAERRFGEFELVRELGRGGMGVVYLARHTELERAVAIKTLSSDQGGDAVRERFAIEARMAARLKHPNIVGIHQIGEVRGEAYIVMDLVEGGSLRERLDAEERLDPREAARVTEALARALGYAHGQAVLHRDLKPANILFDAAGEPLITDFGLAKDVEQDEGITQTGQIMGTPCYMPPEQASGRLDLVDRRADVYSLGATLYAMLTGTPPFDGATTYAVLNAVINDAPQPPSRSGVQLDPALETICLKSLAKDPDERYETAQAFADDLGRYLRNEPILARPPSRFERATKWVQRNRVQAQTLVASSAVALILLLASAAYYTQQVRKANADLAQQSAEASRQRDLAQERGEEAETQRRLAEERGRETASQRDLAQEREKVAEAALEDIIRGAQEHFDDLSDPSARAFRAWLLERVLGHLRKLHELRGQTEGATMKQGVVYEQLTRLSAATGNWKDARELGEKTQTIFREILERDGPSQSARDGLLLALVLTGDALRNIENDDQALERYEEALRLAKSMASAGEEADSTKLCLAISLRRVGDIQERKGQLDKALRAYDASLARCRALVASDPKAIQYKGNLATSLFHVGDIHMRRREFELSFVAHDEALKLCHEVLKANPLSDRAQQLLVLIAQARFDAHEARGDLAKALPVVREATVGARRIHLRDPNNARPRYTLALMCVKLARALEASGEARQAYDSYSEAVSQHRWLQTKRPGDLQTLAGIVDPLVRMGELLLNQGQNELALPALQEGLKVQTKVLAEGPQFADEADLSNLNYQISQLLYQKGEPDNALRHARTSLALDEKQPASPATWRGTAITLDLVAQILRGQQKQQAALVACLGSVVLGRKVVAATKEKNDRHDLAIALWTLGQVQWEVGNDSACLAAYGETVGLLRQLCVEEPSNARFVEERDWFAKALENTQLTSDLLTGKVAPKQASDYLHLAYTHFTRKAFARSVLAFEKALEDEGFRANIDRGNLYNAACAASLASVGTADDQNKALLNKALGWLREDLKLRADTVVKAEAFLKAGDLNPENTARCQQILRDAYDHLEHARVRDSDLAPLRKHPGFKELFGD
jgi:tetratricopeptide (TPR) repeat protein/predicted Ser/Thr protein kinase